MNNDENDVLQDNTEFKRNCQQLEQKNNELSKRFDIVRRSSINLDPSSELDPSMIDLRMFKDNMERLTALYEEVDKDLYYLMDQVNNPKELKQIERGIRRNSKRKEEIGELEQLQIRVNCYLENSRLKINKYEATGYLGEENSPPNNDDPNRKTITQESIGYDQEQDIKIRQEKLLLIEESAKDLNIMTKSINQDIFRQGEKLNQVTSRIITADNNMAHAEEELIEADQYSSGNKNWLWKWVICIFLALVVITIIVIVVKLTNNKPDVKNK